MPEPSVSTTVVGSGRAGNRPIWRLISAILAVQVVKFKWGKMLMRRLILGLSLAVPTFCLSSASAMPGATPDPLLQNAVVSADILVEIKGGQSRGRALGWSKGKKVGWRGRGCPPGLAKQGRC